MSEEHGEERVGIGFYPEWSQEEGRYLPALFIDGEHVCTLSPESGAVLALNLICEIARSIARDDLRKRCRIANYFAEVLHKLVPTVDREILHRVISAGTVEMAEVGNA